MHSCMFDFSPQQIRWYMVVLDHRYRRGNQSVTELDLEVQLLNLHASSDQQVGTFGEGSQSNAYHLKMGGCISNYQQPQSPMMLNMFGSTSIDDTMYSTPLSAIFDPTLIFLHIKDQGVLNTSRRPTVRSNMAGGEVEYIVSLICIDQNISNIISDYSCW